ncbi:MAG: hypothetical protein ACE5G1_11250 [bacterium]
MKQRPPVHIVKSILWLAVLFSIPLPAALKAEPYLAVRTGLKCSACHVNMSGGGKRTQFGVIYSQTYLPLFTRILNSKKSFFSSALNDQISIGGNLRVINKTTFGEGRREPTEHKRDNTFDITEGNVYFEMEVVRNLVSVYVDETLAPSGASNREAALIIKNLPFNSYLKAGRILLPYGYRLLNDDSFIRQKTGFNYDNQDLGGEIGLEPGPFSLIMALSNGTLGSTDSNLDKQFSTVGSYITRHFRIGGSFARNRASDVLRYTYGGFIGLYAGRFTVLAEADVIDERIENQTNPPDQFAFFSELDFLLLQGLNLKFAYDFYDPFKNIAEDERDVITIGVECFVTPFLQFRTLYRRLDSIAQKPREKEDQFFIELHTYL